MACFRLWATFFAVFVSSCDTQGGQSDQPNQAVGSISLSGGREHGNDLTASILAEREALYQSAARGETFVTSEAGLAPQLLKPSDWQEISASQTARYFLAIVERNFPPHVDDNADRKRFRSDLSLDLRDCTTAEIEKDLGESGRSTAYFISLCLVSSGTEPGS